MSEQNTHSKTQPDAGLAEEEHPRPSQAEGDLETIEEDLAEKENASSASASGKK